MVFGLPRGCYSMRCAVVLGDQPTSQRLLRWAGTHLLHLPPLPPLSSRLLSHWCAWAGALFVVQEDPNFVEALASECARLMVTTCHAFTSYRSRSTLLLAAAPNAGAGRCRMAGWACWLCCGRTSPSRCTCWRKCAKLGAAFRQRLLFGGQYARACRGVLPWRWLDCA